MTVNSEIHVERRLVYHESTANTPSTRRHVANDYLARIEFFNPSAITRTGRYETTTIKKLLPTKTWHRASKGTTSRFKGCLSELFPELKQLDEQDLRDLERKRHDF